MPSFFRPSGRNMIEGTDVKRVFTGGLVFGAVKLEGEGARRPVVARLSGDTVVVEGEQLPYGEVEVLLPNLGWVRASVASRAAELPLAA